MTAETGKHVPVKKYKSGYQIINFVDMQSVAGHQNLKKIQIFRFPCCSTREDLSIDV